MQNVKALILAANLPRDEVTAVAGTAAAHTLHVGNQPLVSFALDAARGAGIDDVAIVVCRESRRHVRAALTGLSSEPLVLIETAEPLNFAESIVAASDFLGSSPFLVHSGDAILLQPLGPFVSEMAAGVADALLLRSGRASDRPVVQILNGNAKRFVSDDSLAGAHLFGPRTLQTAAAVGTTHAGRSVSAFVAALEQAGHRVETRNVTCSWTYEGTIDHVLEANRMVLDELQCDLPDHGCCEDSQIDGRVSLHPSACLERTTVRGPAVIGAGAVLRDAFVGPYSSIGANVMIEGAEIEHSIVLAGATIRHPGQRLESSLVGEGATVARDFTVRSSFRVRVGERTEVRLV